jgi:hypothetical protein
MFSEAELKEAVNLLETEGKTFTQYLSGYIPVINKMSAEEIVNLFENAKNSINIKNELIKIKNADELIDKLNILIKEYKYPPNQEVDKYIKLWNLKKIDEKELLKKLSEEINRDLGLGTSKEYIDKTLYIINGSGEPDKSFATNKAKLMKYVTNIVLRGVNLGVKSNISLELQKSVVCCLQGEEIIKQIVASNCNK